MNGELFQFVETTVFTKQIDSQSNSTDILFAIQNDLLNNPEKGDVVQGTGGARKARVGNPATGKGKSGAYRYLYVYFTKDGIIYLLFLFPKSEQADLTKDQKKVIAQMIGEARRNLEKNRG